MSNIDMNEIERSVEKLLSSHLSLKEISQESGISESILKKISSGEQEIPNAKFNTIRPLYEYYLKKESEIFKNYQYSDDLKNVKLPKKILTLINDIDNAINYLNENKDQIGKVEYKNIYIVDKKGELSYKSRLMTIDTLIPLNTVEEIEHLRAVKEPYHLIVNQLLEDSIDNFTKITIKFNKQDLIQELKEIKSQGNAISIHKEGDYNMKSIGVNFKKDFAEKYKGNSYVGGFETDFLSIDLENNTNL